ncbi:MAG: YggT family protein [Gammaproteobacteria bacterium]
MEGQYFSNAGLFLIRTIIGLYLLIILLRFLFQWVRADFYNPISQFLVKATNPLLLPLRRVIPGFGGLDMAAVVLLIVIQVLEYVLIGLLPRFSIPAPTGLLIMSIADLLALTINVFFFGILIQIIISWVNPQAYNPVIGLLHQLNEPLLGRARRLLPPMSGLDLSPIAVFIALKLIEFLLVHPLRDLGRGLAY